MLKQGLKYFMAMAYVAAGFNHFWHPDFYIKIMPPYIPAHELMVQASGVAEILLGVGLLIPATQVLAAWSIVAMLLVFFTVHIHMLVKHGAYDWPYLGLVARIPLQFLLIAWAWWYTRRDARDLNAE